jgi:hypothetical protein
LAYRVAWFLTAARRWGKRAVRQGESGDAIASLIATVVDTADSVIRRLGGQRLCAFCLKWAKSPYKSGELYFCDRIHSSIFFNKQKEAMKQAIEKKRSQEKERQK